MNAESGHIDRDDARRDRRAVGVGTSLVLIAMVLMSVLHSIVLTRMLGTAVPAVVWNRIVSTTVMSAIAPALLLACGLARASGWWGAMLAILPAATIASFVREGVLWLFGAWDGDLTALWLAGRLVDWLGGIALCVCAAMIGFFYLHNQRTLRTEERLSGRRATQRELALRSLEREEVRVRRSIAEGLHGSLQQRLVVQSIRLEILIDQVSAHGVDPEIVESLRELRDEIDTLREHDVREVSRMLYPEGIEVGMVPAIRILLRRLPPSIATSFDVSDEVRRADDPSYPGMTQAARLLAVRFVEEMITNGLRHGNATAFAVAVDLVDGALSLEVANDGVAMDIAAVESGSGLRRLNERLALVGGAVEIVSDGKPRLSGDGVMVLPASERGVRLRAMLPIGDLSDVAIVPEHQPVGGQ